MDISKYTKNVEDIHKKNVELDMESMQRFRDIIKSIKDTDKAIELGDLYFEIQNYNYEAKRIRDATEYANLHPGSTNESTNGSHSSELKDRFNHQTKPALLTHLREIQRWLSSLA